jgi:D-tyrosyl-tRNA(Tyr) deacylase
MRAVIQRVSEASVTIGGKQKASIKSGLLILLGIEEADSPADIEWLSGKIVRLRIFSDLNQLMNLSIQDIRGDILVISQFTLFADTKKGNRPSFIRAARPDIAIPLYNKFLVQLEKDLTKPVYSGEFGADMKVKLINDGPVTLLIDTKNKDA